MRLLVSAITAAEAVAALDGGADILDVKNPAEGSLGAPAPEVLRQIRAAAPRPQQVSAAIGDVPDLPGTVALAALGAAACGADYVKVGLAGPQTAEAAVRLMIAVRSALAEYPNVAVIAAAYADAGRAGTLDPRLLPGIARDSGAAGCLLDTAIKDGRSLFEFLAPDTIARLVDEAHRAGLLFALAGALGRADLPLVQSLGVDIVGIRSAACRDSRRTGPLDATKVRDLCDLLAGLDSMA